MLDAPVGTIKGRMRLGLEKLHAQLTATVEVAR
jgi:DNA-directed RNA polymerase specialized sigma24 family protein